MRTAVLLLLFAVPLSAKILSFTDDERTLLVSTLHEPGGLLASAINTSGVSAKQALLADPLLNVADWVRTNTFDDAVFEGSEDDADSCSLHWEAMISEGLDITGENKVPESDQWTAKSEGVTASVVLALVKKPVEDHNQDGNPTALYGSDFQQIGTMLSGDRIVVDGTLWDKIEEALKITPP